MSENINTDKSLREKLENFSVQPPPHVWENIKGQMAVQKRKKRIAYIGWISAAAVVVFAFIAGWFFNENSKELMPTTVEQQQVQPKNEERESGLQTTEIDVEDNGDDQAGKTILGGSEENVAVGKAYLVSNKLLEEQKTDKSFVVSIERFSLELLEGIEAFFTMDEPEVYLAERTEQQPKISLTEKEEVLIAENVRNINKTVEKDNGWILGMYVSPGYSSHTAKHTDQYAQNMTYSAESSNSNMGAGFSVQYKTGKKLRIESGVYYAQNGQKSGNSFELFALRGNADYATSAPEMLDGSQPLFSNTVQLNNSGITMNSTAGVINMRATPKGSEIAANLENSKYAYSNTLQTTGEFSQVFEFVEIPFYLRYSVIDKRFGVELMGGLNAGVVVGNNAYIDNEYGNQNIGSTADISTLNISGTVGVGVNYALGKHLSLAVEPRLNYYLNSINTNPDVEYRPYRVGVFTGLYYEF